MRYLKRLTKVYKNSPKINYDEDSKFIIMSDVHRGDGGWADSFSKNQNTFFAALTYYFNENYTYIELGDGDELWENRNINDIINAHSDAFWVLKKFHEKKRLHMIYGNHDIVKKYPFYVEKNLFQYFNQRDNEYCDLLRDIKIHEGLILQNKKNHNEIMLLHGHQVDFLNSDIWRVARFLVRYFWKPLENFCLHDVTRTAKNYKKKNDVAMKLSRWASKENKIMVAGHTHRPMFPKPGKPPYFNDGSCVHPRCITGIEISGGEITLIKWAIKSNSEKMLKVEREILAGPNKINDYFEKAR
ncbi:MULTISPECIES: metallophosphoesterase family protein [unclassified Sedimentibacter]|uniref:metallophosphoesterase family protein n=1 Tax=unclassified Sedimentibacter TaxID=2649220 RepID=UPI0027E20CA8|nr:metallophosphoesterase family protein [Sedimentibacter sp. MB35-C1]WMJ76764.1 metallophosphoesterase family protein [Sedimentibacter sp. MB35-C1]